MLHKVQSACDACSCTQRMTKGFWTAPIPLIAQSMTSNNDACANVGTVDDDACLLIAEALGAVLTDGNEALLDDARLEGILVDLLAAEQVDLLHPVRYAT